VQEIDSLDHFNKEEAKRRAEKEKNLSHQSQLQFQLDAKRNVTDRCRDVWKQWRTELEDDVVQYEKEEVLKKTFAKDAQKLFNQERQQQLADKRERQLVQKDKDRRLELEMIQLAEESKRRSDAADEQRKQQQKGNMVHMRAQAEQAVERRFQAKQLEHKRDLEMQKEYEEMLEQQERNRGQYFKNIRDKQSQLLAKYEQGVGGEMARLQARDDERARKQQEEKLDKERLDHEARDAWRKGLAQSGRVAVQVQLDLQAEARQKQREEERRYLEKGQKETQIAEAKEAEKVRRQKAAVQANADFIRAQIQEKESRSPGRKNGQAQMSERERQINKEKLDRACDPERADGLQSLLGRKREEYRQLHMQREKPLGMPG